jgi:hypothetical protein
MAKKIVSLVVNSIYLEFFLVVSFKKFKLDKLVHFTFIMKNIINHNTAQHDVNFKQKGSLK